MAQTNVQVPPDSTGKKIATGERSELHFDNYNPAVLAFNEGDIVTGAQSGTTGEITAVITEGFPTGEGELYLKDVPEGQVFNDNEDLQVSASTVAVANLVTDPFTTLQYQKQIIVDPNNPEFQQRIDRFGATVNTFTDGAPTFSPFGAMTVGERQTIKDYSFSYSARDDLFYNNITGSATSTYDSDAGTNVLTCTTGATDGVTRTSHFYHPYSPGIGQLTQMTAQIGDMGKANVVRRWGYYDDNDGVFWELDGTQLAIVMRSSVTGSVTEMRVLQDDFNRDKLDGSDSIGFDLDVSLANIYWIDLQWLGSGRVRYGVMEPRGEQIVAHVMEHANTTGVTYPYMRTATLPFRYEQINTGSAASTSEFRVACGSVKHSSEVKIVGAKWSADGQKTITNAEGEKVIMGIRPALLFNSLENHAITKIISLTVTNACTTGTSPLIIRAYAGVDAMLTGSSWVSAGTGSCTEIEMSATAIAGAKQSFTFGCGANDTEFFQDAAPRDLHSIELTNFADNATQPMFYLTAELPVASAESIIDVGINWEEIIS